MFPNDPRYPDDSEPNDQPYDADELYAAGGIPADPLPVEPPRFEEDVEAFESVEMVDAVEEVEAEDEGIEIDDAATDFYPDREREYEPLRARGTNNDPMFGYLLALALSIGLTPLIPDNADLRYALVWGLLSLFGVLAWLFGTTTRIVNENAENLAWGVVFGLIVGAPLLLAGGETLTTTARVLFQTVIGGEIRTLPPGVVLMLLLFVMPLAETLFFRALLQYNRSFWLVGAFSSVWAIILFIPMLDVGEYPVVAVIIGVALIMVNLMYSYVRQRNGLAAAWLCQIVVNFVVLFLPYLGT